MVLCRFTAEAAEAAEEGLWIELRSCRQTPVVSRRPRRPRRL